MVVVRIRDQGAIQMICSNRADGRLIISRDMVIDRSPCVQVSLEWDALGARGEGVRGEGRGARGKTEREDVKYYLYSNIGSPLFGALYNMHIYHNLHNTEVHHIDNKIVWDMV